MLYLAMQIKSNTTEPQWNRQSMSKRPGKIDKVFYNDNVLMIHFLTTTLKAIAMRGQSIVTSTSGRLPAAVRQTFVKWF